MMLRLLFAILFNYAPRPPTVSHMQDDARKRVRQSMHRLSRAIDEAQTLERPFAPDAVHKLAHRRSDH